MTALEPITDPSADPNPADLWRAYELAQQHYDSNIQLFSVRMNLFLLVQSALVAVGGNSVLGGKAVSLASRSAISAFGLLLAIGWLLVAASSYCWVKTWRAHMIQLGKNLEQATGVVVSSSLSPATGDGGHFRNPSSRSLLKHSRGLCAPPLSHVFCRFSLWRDGSISVGSPDKLPVVNAPSSATPSHRHERRPGISNGRCAHSVSTAALSSGPAAPCTYSSAAFRASSVRRVSAETVLSCRVGSGWRAAAARSESPSGTAGLSRLTPWRLR